MAKRDRKSKDESEEFHPHGDRKAIGLKAKVLEFADRGVYLSIRQLSNEVGMDKTAIRRRVKLAKLESLIRSDGTPVYKLRDFHDKVILRHEDGTMNPDMMDAYSRKAYYATELDKMKLEVERSLLIPVYEVEQKMAAIAKMVAQFFDTLPDILERDCGATPEILKKTEQKLDEVRENIYLRMKEDSEADEPVSATRASK